MQHQNLAGILSSTFQLGGKGGSQFKAVSDGFELVNAAGTTLVRIKAAGTDGTSVDQLVSWLNTRSSAARIDFAFTGGTPPSAGVNTDKFGICHTTGGSYTAGSLIYDSGTALVVIPVGNHVIIPSIAVSGTVTLEADKAYYNKTSTAPYTWTSCGGGATTGLVKEAKVSAGTGATTSSTTVCSNGARLTSCRVYIGTAYNNAAVITLSLGSLTIGTISGTDSATTGPWEFSPPAVDVSTGGAFTVAISNVPTTGALTASVYYTDTQLS